MTETPEPPADITDWAAPNNPDLERALLSAILQHPELLDTLDTQPEDHYQPAHEQIHHTIAQLHTQGIHPDPVTVADELNKHRQLTNIGGYPYLAELVTTPAIPSNATWYAAQLRDLARRRHALTRLARARQILTSPNQPVDTAIAYLADLTAGADPAAAADDAHTRAVTERANRLRIDRDAKRLLANEAQNDDPEPDAGTLAEILARPPEPPHRVENLIPSNASTLIVAQRKTGKTTLILNHTRCLITGEHLLGRFPVRPIPPDTNVAILNFEVSGAQLAQWANEAGVPTDRLWIENLRGRRNPLTHPDDRQALAERLRTNNTAALFVDPFGRAYTGLSQNDPGEVGAWLVDLDRFTRGEVGATDLILATHAGWNGERTRGSSALEDWADSIITLTRDETTDIRYIRAIGRDVELEEDQLAYDHPTRWLSLTGTGNRKAAAETRRIDELADTITTIIESTPNGLTGYKVAQELRTRGIEFRNGEHTKALTRAVERGDLAVHDGPRNAKIYRIADPETPKTTHLSPPIPTYPGDRSSTYPHLPIGGGIGGTGQVTPETPGQVTPEPELPNLPQCTTCGNPVDPGRSLCHTCAQAEAIAFHRRKLTGTTDPSPRPTTPEPIPPINNHGGQMPPFPEPPF